MVKENILGEPAESEWDEEMAYALACYKLATDGGDGESDEEDLRNHGIA